MSCCAPGAEGALDIERMGHGLPSAEELKLAARALGDGRHQVDLSVPSVHCGACIRSIETALRSLDHVESARVNLSTRRVAVRWQGDDVPPIPATLAGLGYEAHLFDHEGTEKDATLAELIRAVAVAGFAAGNIMLLSVSVWSGAEDATRDLFHWISALIAIPALVFAGRIYFRSAWSALRHGRMNMDVPIAVGVSLAYGMSLYETINHGPHAYFDAAVSLLFFLLIGRTLDHVMRNRARAAVLGLSRLAPRGAVVLTSDGQRDYRPVGEIEPGMRLAIAAGDRIPLDARVIEGRSEIDASLITGESDPQPVSIGTTVRAGTHNLTGPLTVQALAAVKDSFLSEMLRMMEAAEGGRAGYRRIADRVSSLYAPVVHLTALLTFLGWMAISGDWHRATTIAIAVLIITCPCALGLAVPIVQVVAARRLFEHGIMVKDGSAMERLADIDMVVFDKTGTLTLGRPRLVNAASIHAETLSVAAALARHSRHPLSLAIAEASPVANGPRLADIAEMPGLGIEAKDGGSTWRLGRAEWAMGGNGEPGNRGTVLAQDGMKRAVFVFEDVLRPDARAAIAELKETGMRIEMLSGDRSDIAEGVAGALEIENFAAGLLPAGKVERLAALAAQGRKTAMVGDGLNDAPALAAAHVSIAPATAADIGRNAADFVFLRESLSAIPLAVAVSRQAGRLIRQNLGLAILYNAIAVPIAILGFVTPLVAAIAMSGSSLLVIGNALRLGIGRKQPEPAATSRSATRPAMPAIAQ
ncbi:copper-translocating P-type ATPase [Mesorhizobium sp. L-8-10]|uniref:cation-translocating P-type ATPase n=1 Tax=Mesorhizobium sp. L-8-10 TaxID=2744523 RepID=UPI0019260DE7|nr:cation-translocating P-type ATPase [Mesorhizobium sp. L-8-10]BCH33306.1 copper-translocating P-type ATPase [Mesorhizobium sp. L-8-10]